MKRVLVGIMAALVLAAGTTSSFALNSETMTTEIGQNFADADGDGICDNCGAYQKSGANGNGGNSANNNASSGNGQGKNFANSNAGSRSGRNYTDADGDGVCDYYNGCHGTGRGNGFQHGRNR